MQKQKSVQFLRSTDQTKIHNLKSEWLNTLTAPQDGMWESFTDNADHWIIVSESKPIGYACVDEEGLLLQFYVNAYQIKNAQHLFGQFIVENQIKKALIGTNNPIALTAALHHQKKVEVHTYLFSDILDVQNQELEGTLITAEDRDLTRIVDFYQKSINAPKDWLIGYVGDLIGKQEIFAFQNNEEIIGTCEVRKSGTNQDIGDIGMAVSPDYRKKGVGTYLLGRAKEIAKSWGKRPICSCEKTNVGSIKCIQNNGFRSVHQMLSMEF